MSGLNCLLQVKWITLRLNCCHWNNLPLIKKLHDNGRLSVPLSHCCPVIPSLFRPTLRATIAPCCFTAPRTCCVRQRQNSKCFRDNPQFVTAVIDSCSTIEGWHEQLSQEARQGSLSYMLITLVHDEAVSISLQVRLVRYDTMEDIYNYMRPTASK